MERLVWLRDILPWDAIRHQRENISLNMMSSLIVLSITTNVLHFVSGQWSQHIPPDQRMPISTWGPLNFDNDTLAAEGRRDDKEKFEEFYFLLYNVLKSSESQPTFRRIYRLHLQGQKVNQAINQYEAGSKQSASCWFFPCLTLRPWRWWRHIAPKHWLTFTSLHGVISQKTEPSWPPLWEPQI
jgi:hypothetical protein